MLAFLDDSNGNMSIILTTGVDTLRYKGKSQDGSDPDRGKLTDRFTAGEVKKSDYMNSNERRLRMDTEANDLSARVRSNEKKPKPPIVVIINLPKKLTSGRALTSERSSTV